MVYRYGLVLAGGQDAGPDQVDTMIGAAVTAAERYYPAMQLLIWGDITHVPDIQAPRPEVTIAFDTDPRQAEACRRRVFDMTASDRMLVAGMHLHFPACSHVVREGDGYRVIPEIWQQ